MLSVAEDTQLHFLNESTGVVVPRDDEIGKFVNDKDVVRCCTSEELEKLLERFATRDLQIDAEIMAPNKGHTPLGAAM
ncbi:hypothetical protein PINS_up007143 [Pythium insidiosum]|nr:hypothetical protein PINS_up007143 [Pythium insidiosum]